MLFRIALFISLVALFYYYCNNDGSSVNYRVPNDINMIEVPKEFYPTSIIKSTPEASIKIDSVSTHRGYPILESKYLSSIPQKY